MYKRGDSWYSDFWHKGKRYTKSHGRLSKTIAKEKDRDFRVEVASGAYAARQNDPQFTQALEEHLKKSEAENQESTHKRNLLSARHLKAHFAKRRISEIEGNEVLMRK